MRLNGARFVLALGSVSLLVAPTLGCTEEAPPREQVTEFEYAVPLDSESPWPKFRRTAMQSGRSPVLPIDTGADPWSFPTGKGIFSTAVIDGDDNVYVGSADRYFYKLDKSGKEVWKALTGEIIDSSALLDDEGIVYFGSGDGFLRALDRDDGTELWKFEADDPSVNEGAFIRWFEGNVGMGLDGTLYAPNGNHCTYAIDRASGTKKWCFVTDDQTWSLPALNPVTDRLFMGSNFPFADTVFAIDPADGTSIWSAATVSSVAASPMLSSSEPDGLMSVGGFDGFLHAYSQDEQPKAWEFGARDHIYASPAQAADGTIIQPSADGTIYAIDPADGSQVWAYDTREPIRSSPAIDGDGNIYVGSGEGQLFVLNEDGSLRWSIQLIDALRDDLNSSPALGKELIVISGESGEVFGIPYDYCLRSGLQDDRCTVGPGEALPNEGAFVVYTTSFGGLELDPPTEISANLPLTFTLFVREDGNTKLAAIDTEGFEVTTSPEVDIIADVAGDSRYITVIPNGPWVGDAGGTIEVQVKGNYLDQLLSRDGLVFEFEPGVGGTFDETFRFDIAARTETAFPYPVAATPTTEAGNIEAETGIVELYRISAPLPTILPSYNQIGFDSIHYVIGLVERDGDEIVSWGVGGDLDDNGDTIVDPESRIRFPLVFRWDDGLLTMVNEEGFTIEFNGFPLPFQYFRVATTLDADGNAKHSPSLNAKTICEEIDFYGIFLQLLGFCNVDTDLLDAVGGSEYRPFGEDGTQSAPAENVGTVTFSRPTATRVRATLAEDTSLQAEAHNYGLLVLDATTGVPVGLNYTDQTSHFPDIGDLQRVDVDLTDVENVPEELRVYLMVDTYPASVGTVGAP